MKISILNLETHLYEEVYNAKLTTSIGVNPGLIGADLVSGQQGGAMISFTPEELVQIKEWASKI